MVKKLTGPDARSATALARETGVSQATLSRWLKQAGTLRGMSNDTAKPSGVASGARSRRPQDWTADEKLRAVVEAASLSEEELGAFLRREGLHEAQLRQWREDAKVALSSRRSKTSRSPAAKRLRQLERELRRKDKALAEAAALLVLQKKVQALWADEDDDTEPRRGK